MRKGQAPPNHRVLRPATNVDNLRVWQYTVPTIEYRTSEEPMVRMPGRKGEAGESPALSRNCKGSQP